MWFRYAIPQCRSKGLNIFLHRVSARWDLKASGWFFTEISIVSFPHSSAPSEHTPCGLDISHPVVYKPQNPVSNERASGLMGCNARSSQQRLLLHKQEALGAGNDHWPIWARNWSLVEETRNFYHNQQFSSCLFRDIEFNQDCLIWTWIWGPVGSEYIPNRAAREFFDPEPVNGQQFRSQGKGSTSSSTSVAADKAYHVVA